MTLRNALLLTLLAAAHGLPVGQDNGQQVLGYDPVERARMRDVCPPYTLYASIPQYVLPLRAIACCSTLANNSAHL